MYEFSFRQRRRDCTFTSLLICRVAPQQTGTWPVFTLGKEYAVKLFPKWGSDQHHGEEGQVVWDREVKSYAVLCDAPRDIGTLIPWEGMQGLFLSPLSCSVNKLFEPNV